MINDMSIEIRMPKFDIEKNRKMTKAHLDNIIGGIALGAVDSQEMPRDIEDVKAVEDFITQKESLNWKDVEAMRARSVRMRMVEYPLECIRDRILPPDEETLKTLLKEALEIQSLKDDERIAGVISEIKMLLGNR
jgi:hypothetical protein